MELVPGARLEWQYFMMDVGSVIGVVASVCIAGGWLAGAVWYGQRRNPPLKGGDMGDAICG